VLRVAEEALSTALEPTSQSIEVSPITPAQPQRDFQQLIGWRLMQLLPQMLNDPAAYRSVFSHPDVLEVDNKTQNLKRVVDRQLTSASYTYTEMMWNHPSMLKWFDEEILAMSKEWSKGKEQPNAVLVRSTTQCCV